MESADASVDQEDTCDQNDNDGDYFPFSEYIVGGTYLWMVELTLYFQILQNLPFKARFPR
jgi:hypothetical protein